MNREFVGKSITVISIIILFLFFSAVIRTDAAVKLEKADKKELNVLVITIDPTIDTEYGKVKASKYFGPMSRFSTK